MSDRITDLLHEVADAVEPGDRLDAIRAETGVRRPGRGWWAAGGVGLVAASVVAALALSTGTSPEGGTPDPAGTSDPDPTATSTVATRTVPIYFVGDTADGPRLFREWQKGPGPMSAETFALDAALSGASLDPDYRSAWPAGTVSGGYLMSEEEIVVSVTGDVRDRPAGMSAGEAALAVEQLVRTAQALLGQGRVPVRLMVDNERTDQVLGIRTAQRLSGGPDLEVLAPVSLSDPREGLRVDNDEPITVRGTTFAPDGTVTTRLQRWEGTFVAAEQVDRVGLANEGPVSFTATFALGELPPGDYVVIAEVTDPSGRLTTDTRRITVVD